jgi:uncharacterized protein YcbK (DUF882 family)
MPAFSPPRRRLLLAAACGIVSASASATPPADDLRSRLLATSRSLWLVRGKEETRATWWTAERGFDRDQYLALCWALRDVQANRVFPMDRRLLDQLAALQAWLARNGIGAPLEIRSGYRTRATNGRTEGAALASRHLVGQAADITVAGVTNLKLAGMASVLGAGGTGFYPGRHFVHVDTGNERVWITAAAGSPRPARRD